METTISSDTEKSIARTKAARVRKIAHQKLKNTAPDLLAKTGLDFLPQSNDEVISGYMPYQSEISVIALLSSLSAQKHTICLPVVEKAAAPLIFRQWTPGKKTEPGKWDIPVPLVGNKVVEPDTLLIPLLAFDINGYRLGYGGGFYDRTIQQLRRQKLITTIGVAYSAQIMENLPIQPHDQKLDWILTEKGPIKCG